MDGVDAQGTVTCTDVMWYSAISDPTKDVAWIGTGSANDASGTFTITGGVTATGNWRAVKFNPTGTMFVAGPVGGNPVNIISNRAFCERHYDDAALTQLSTVVVVFTDADLEFELQFDAAGLAAGTLNVPLDITANVSHETDAGAVAHAVQSGGVNVTRYDASGFAADFSIILDTGENLNGSFDCAFDLNTYDP
jgi:hypothetical protein